MLTQIMNQWRRADTPGFHIAPADNGGEHYRINADNVRNYLLKYACREAAGTLGPASNGERRLVIGKRCGRSQNMGG